MQRYGGLVKKEFRTHPSDPNRLTLRLGQEGETAIIEVLLARQPLGSITLEPRDAHVLATIKSEDPTIDDTARLMRASSSDELRLRYITLIDRLKALELHDATIGRVIDHPSAKVLDDTLAERELQPQDAPLLREFEKLVAATEAFAAATRPQSAPRP